MNMSINMKGDGPGPGRKVVAETGRPGNLWNTILRLSGYMRRYTPLICLTMAMAIAGTLMQVVSPKLLGNATTLLFQSVKTGDGVDFSALIAILLGVAALGIGIFLTTFLQERMMTVVSQRTTQILRRELKAKMNRLPVSFFDRNSTGNLMSVASNDVDNIATSLQQSLTQLISSVVLIAGTLVFMLTISPALTLLACVMLPSGTLIAKGLTPLIQKNNKKFVGGIGELNGRIEETFQGFVVIKSFNGEQDALEKFNAVNDTVCQSGWRAKFFGGSMMHLMMLVQNAIYILIAALGAVMVVGGSILIGNLQAFLQYSQQFTSPISKLSMIWTGLLSSVASAERIFELLDAEEMAETQLDVPEWKGDSARVSFEQVCFGYTETPLMDGFSLEVKDGEMVAIVGHTGAGKTTLINLLERFYDIQGGSIRIDGSDIRSLPRTEVRKRIGMVLQDTWLFAGTIYDNICFGNENATEEQVYAAAQAAYADDFIRRLPEGYNTVLGEDADNISLGQRQLITIARAFVADPDILILDEATSSVDSRTELVIQKAMRSLLKGRTSFVVAHRLSTIYDADNIIVMQNGDIVETGSHQELLNQKGPYADIYNSQFSTHAA